MRISEALTKLESLSEIKVTKVKKKLMFTKAEMNQQIVDNIRKCVQRHPNIYLFSVQHVESNVSTTTDGHFIFSDNEIIRLALGENDDYEIEKDLHKLSLQLNGKCGLLFTHRNEEEVLQYAQNGFIATETVVLPEGLFESHTMATFTFEIECRWSKNGGYKSYVINDLSTDTDDDDDDDINVCKMFLRITENLIKKRGVSSLQIPSIFYRCGEKATELFCSIDNQLKKPFVAKKKYKSRNESIEIKDFCGIDKQLKKPIVAQKKYKSRNGSFKIKDFLINLLKEQNGVIIWMNESKKIFKFNDPKRAAFLWGTTKPNRKSEMTYDKMTRALRYLYNSGELQKVSNEEYTFQFL